MVDTLNLDDPVLTGVLSDLDDLPDGVAYQRVASSEVDEEGRVTQISDGINSITADSNHPEKGHDHNGINSKPVSHQTIMGLGPDQHHEENHGGRHYRHGEDEILADELLVSFIPEQYMAVINNLRSHLSGIDRALQDVRVKKDEVRRWISDMVAGTPGAEISAEYDDQTDRITMSISIDHSSLMGKTEDDHHPRVHLLDQEDHEGTLPESRVRFAPFMGHTHDGERSSQIPHSYLLEKGKASHEEIDTHIIDSVRHREIDDEARGPEDLLSAQKILFELGRRAPVVHAASHVVSGTDPIRGEGLRVDYPAINYRPGNSLQSHLEGIDAALGSQGRTPNLIGGNLAILWEREVKFRFLESDQVTLVDDLSPLVVTLEEEPVFDSRKDKDLDGNEIMPWSVYDFFLEFSNLFSATLVCKRWAGQQAREIYPGRYKGMVVQSPDTPEGRSRRFIATVATDAEGNFRDNEFERYVSNLYHTEKKVLMFPNPFGADSIDFEVPNNWDQWHGDWEVRYVYHGLGTDGVVVKNGIVSMRAGCVAPGCSIGIGYSKVIPRTDRLLEEVPLKGLRSLFPLCAANAENATLFLDSCLFKGWIEG